MTRITDAVRTANRIMRKYDERDPERIAHYAGIMILPQPFVKQKGAYTVMMRKPIIFIKRDLHPAMRSIVLAHELGHHFLHRQEAMQSGGFHEFNLFDIQPRGSENSRTEPEGLSAPGTGISKQIPEIMRLLPYRLSDKRTQDVGE